MVWLAGWMILIVVIIVAFVVVVAVVAIVVAIVFIFLSDLFLSSRESCIFHGIE